MKKILSSIVVITFIGLMCTSFITVMVDNSNQFVTQEKIHSPYSIPYMTY